MSIRQNPFEEMNRLFESMRNAFWDPDAYWGEESERALAPATFGRTNLDLAEREGELVLSADLPGFETEEITLTVDEGVLTLSAEHDDERAEEGETMARSRKVFERVTIPKEIDEEGIEATYRNGVLEVRMPVVGEMADEGHVIDIQD